LLIPDTIRNMRQINRTFDLNGFMKEAAEASQKLLLLDYDGTLAPFRKKRDSALPYEGVKGILENILALRSVRTVIISGRPVSDIMALLDMDIYPEIWGCHGAERLDASGEYTLTGIPLKAGEALEKALKDIIRAGLEERCEQKPSSLAVHWRGLPREETLIIKREVERMWRDSYTRAGLSVHEFDGGLELRPSGIDKGHSVKTILKESSPEAFVIYMGDDLTDEDAFRAVKGRGLGILVRNKCRETSADLWLQPPEELLDFLYRLLKKFGEEDE